MWPFRKKQQPAPVVHTIRTKSAETASGYYPRMEDMAGYGATAAPRSDWDRVKAVETHPIMMSCIRRIAEATATCKFGVEAMNGDVITDHPVAQLLDEPNCPGGRWSLLQLIAASLAISGRAYLYAPRSVFRDNLPPQIGFLATHKIQREVDSNTHQVAMYRYTPPAGTIGMIELPPEDVIEIRRHWLTDVDDIFGAAVMPAVTYSQIEPAWNSLRLWSNLTGLINKLLENNGGLPGILAWSQPAADASAGNMLTIDQRSEIADYFKRFSTGGDKFGEIAFLDTAGAKVEFLKITEDFKSMNMEAGKKASAEEICAIYGVPPLILGMGQGATYANQKEARKYFWEDTIIPGYIHPICDALSQALGVRVKPKLDDIPALADYRRDMMTGLEPLTFLTMNEKRRAAGYQDIMGGDIVMVNPLMQPINRVIDTNGNGLSDESDGYIANQEAIRRHLQTGEPLVLPGVHPAAAAQNAQDQQAAQAQPAAKSNVIPMHAIPKRAVETKAALDRARTPRPVKKRPTPKPR